MSDKEEEIMEEKEKETTKKENEKKEEETYLQKEVEVEQLKVQSIPIEEMFIEENSQKAAVHKNNGNQFYKNGDTQNAISQYQLALQYTGEEDHKMRSILYSNISINLIKQEQWKKATGYCQKALTHDENYTKARLNLARCYEEEDKIEESLEEYKKLTEVNPNDKFSQEKVKALQKKVDELNEKRKQEVVSGLKNLGNSVLGYFGLSLDNFKMEQGEGGGYNLSFKQ